MEGTEEASKENAFKNCGRAGRRGACSAVEIPAAKLKEIIEKASTKSVAEGNVEKDPENNDKT